MIGSEQAACACDIPRAEQIARLNDTLRTTATGGTVVMTHGVSELIGDSGGELAAALKSYTAFDVDNDPHGERDFGDIELLGQSLFWKIDYYDAELKYGSSDPADPAVTHRVLTIMLTSEY